MLEDQVHVARIVNQLEVVGLGQGASRQVTRSRRPDSRIRSLTACSRSGHSDAGAHVVPQAIGIRDVGGGHVAKKRWGVGFIGPFRARKQFKRPR